jgi:branched-chain amino acid transport system substrate-binding protein
VQRFRKTTPTGGRRSRGGRAGRWRSALQDPTRGAPIRRAASRRSGKVALLTVVCFVIAACGARVPAYFPPSVTILSGQSGQAAGQAGSATAPGLGATGTNQSGPGSTSSGVSSGLGGSSTGTSPAGTSPGVTTLGGTTQSGGQSRSGPAAATVASLTPSNFDFNPQAEAAYCTDTAGNTSSAPGVTPTSILAGNVSGLTGLVSDSFAPGYQAVTAAFDAVDRFGGICGRQLKLQTEDDQQSSSTNASDVEYLIPKVLAFVGSLSDADNGGVPAMVAAGVPDMGPAINTNRSNSPVYWSATGGSVTVRNGRAYLYNTWLNGLKAYNDLPKTIAVLSYDIAISAQAGQEFAQAFKDAGVGICYSNYAIPPAPGTEMGQIVSTMQSDGCGGVYTTMDVVGNADMLQDMQSDGYHPQLIATTYEGYTPDQISLAGQSAAQGLQVALDSVPLTDNNPGVQLYQQELATYEPGQPESEFGLEAWADAEMYIYALLKAGRNPTRASLVNVLSQITNWTSDGSFGPYTPRVRTAPVCSTNVVVRGSGFVRDWPSSGMYCNGQLIDVGPAS